MMRSLLVLVTDDKKSHFLFNNHIATTPLDSVQVMTGATVSLGRYPSTPPTRGPSSQV